MKQQVKHSFRLEASISRQLGERARATGISKTEIVEAALASLLTPDDEQRIEAVLARRLDRITRQLDRLEWHIELSNETLALFIRFWLTSNPPLPDTALKAAQASGKKRWDSFVQTLTRRITSGPKLRDEMNQDSSDRNISISEYPAQPEAK